MKKNLTAVLAAALACLTLYAQAAPAEIGPNMPAKRRLMRSITSKALMPFLRANIPTFSIPRRSQIHGMRAQLSIARAL